MSENLTSGRPVDQAELSAPVQDSFSNVNSFSNLCRVAKSWFMGKCEYSCYRGRWKALRGGIPWLNFMACVD
ncbi:hypothetical protein OUZ56_009454 [Daphnia magna]|uniref:Uncharacterized protein n=1 Tax=Daphnia magna TaxID=35525 RepID=A0ABR0AG20_9CRUS|nr:hypothetical protein OUZ56_009454 [Daphnia magna]